MPGPVSESSKGPGLRTPYVPSWNYIHGPKMCPCGHHEGYHNDGGKCLLFLECRCSGLPADCLTDWEGMK
jgi:hypothetical protein